MSINILSTANTFGEWLNTTIDIVDTLNLFTDGGAANTFFVNTNLQIANNLTVSGNLTVTGNVTLDNIGYNDLTVAGNATINGTITGANTTVENLTVTENVVTLNVTTTLFVGSNATVYGNLTVANSEIETLNVTSNITFPAISNTTITTLFVSTNANVSGNLTVLGNVAFNDIPTINIVTANVTSLVGVANTEIYAYIEATANSANAGALAADFTALAVALG